MAVSRRLRFEILRRDGHTCRYCGAMAPDVPLTVDHVVPVALGGSDDPTNLVTACADCNAGKSSSSPDAPIVADVADDALRWKRAIEQAQIEFEAERQLADQMLAHFEERWNRWTYAETVTDPPEFFDFGSPLLNQWYNIFGLGYGSYVEFVGFEGGVLRLLVERGWTTQIRGRVKERASAFIAVLGEPVTELVIENAPTVSPPPRQPEPTKREVRRQLPMDNGWRDTISRFLSAGLTLDDLDRLVRVAMERPGVASDDTFRYFCGCAWREITNLQESARRIIESEEEQG